MTAVVRRVVRNPANPEQGMKLWSSGLIQPFGGAPTPAWEIPEGFTDRSAQDLVIIDWLTPSGYVLSWTGRVFHFGGVTPASNFVVTGPAFPIWRRLVMNPAGNGQGYTMDFRGRIYRGGPTLPTNVGGSAGTNSDQLAGGIDWGKDIARDLWMDWSTRRYVILSGHGDLYSPNFSFTLDPDAPRPYERDRDLYRALGFVDPTLPPGGTAGWLVTMGGRTYGFNGAEKVPTTPLFPNEDAIVDFNVVSNGAGGAPLILEYAHRDGRRPSRIVSDPPSIDFLGPDAGSTVTTTTRPRISWDYSDPEGDAQARAEVRLFTAAQVAAPGFSVATTEPFLAWDLRDATTFYVEPDVDLPNGGWKVYGRVTDTAGDRSTWDTQTWTQGVTPPPAPSITTTDQPDSWSILLTVTAGGGTGSGLAATVEFSDDDGTTWETVRGGEAVPYPTTGPKVLSVVDREAPLNLARLYRARTVKVDPALTSAPSASALGLVGSEDWVLSNPVTGEALSLALEPTFVYRRPSGAAARRPLGRRASVVTRLGIGGAEMSLTIRTMNRAEKEAVDSLLEANATIQLRDPYRRSWYLGIVGDLETEMMEVAPAPGEETEFAFAHKDKIEVVETERPGLCVLLPAPTSGSIDYVGGDPGTWYVDGVVYGYAQEEDGPIYTTPSCAR